MDWNDKAKGALATVHIQRVGYLVDEFSKIPAYLKSNIAASAHKTRWSFVPSLDEPRFKRVVSHISTANPKAQRIAVLIMGVTSKVDSAQWIRAFNETFIGPDGRMRAEHTDVLLSRFYQKLQGLARDAARAGKWISLTDILESGKEIPGSKA
ncbi:hypothetical protein H0O00_05130 [Candidatus Micrarchaeota archaeon]|nr:hypothetical protein [Candidatus Micrarchaeota archaeon]